MINGQKIWSSYGHYSDWCFMLARTDPDAPKHRGISYFLVDMKTPGLTVKPLINMAGTKGFNELFLRTCGCPGCPPGREEPRLVHGDHHAVLRAHGH